MPVYWAGTYRHRKEPSAGVLRVGVRHLGARVGGWGYLRIGVRGHPGDYGKQGHAGAGSGSYFALVDLMLPSPNCIGTDDSG